MHKGFTLIEVLTAMFIMMIGVIGVMGLITRTVVFNSSVNSQLVASYLAQEGLEIVRNMRDANFLKKHKGEDVVWNAGLTGCPVGCEIDYNDITYSANPATSTEYGPFQNRLLKLNSGFYAYDAGTDTVFKRKITINSATADVLKVWVDVSWQDKGNTRTVRGATELYNWLTLTP